ncbi:interleukin-12 subunit beta [Silurus meridionalis]|nr:interleukin-12 subunit beta [Silurus meridionalis]
MKQKTSVVLSCGDQFDNSEIHWRKNQEKIDVKGNRVEVSIEAMLGGNFTCHEESGDVLNHTLVLVSPLDFDKAILLRNDDKEFVTCVARNYSGPFHCSWKWDPIRNGVVVFFSASRNSNTLKCSLDADNAGLTCEDLQCPFSEEVTRINLTLLVRNQYRLEEHQRTFFIHDIIKPGKVDITKAENDAFEWKIPKTWNQPCSFFPLRYEVKVVSHRKECEETSGEGNHSENHYVSETHYKVIGRKSYTFCVRAQDSFTNKVWSDWSQHKSVPTLQSSLFNSKRKIWFLIFSFLHQGHETKVEKIKR